MEKRLFIGIKIEPSPKLLEIYQEIKAYLNEERIKWVSNENMHITLKFLGNTNLELIPQIKEEIRNTILNFKSFQLEIKGVGVFKKNNQIKVVWLGIDKKLELNALANQLNGNIGIPGFENAEQVFSAHLTIGRVNSILDEDKIQTLLSIQENSIQDVVVNEIILFESISTPGGVKYMQIERYALPNEC